MTPPVVVKVKYIPPSHKERDFYKEASGYLNYISKKEKGEKQLEAEKESYAGYMINREGSAGYFTNQPNNKVSPIHEKAMIWDMVISFDEKFADQNKILKTEDAKNYVSQTFDNFCRENNLQPDEVQYVAAFHTNTDNPHIHMRVNLTNPNHASQGTSYNEWRVKGKITKESLKNWRGSLEEVVRGRSEAWDFREVADKRKLIRTKVRSLAEKNDLQTHRIISSVKMIINDNSTNRTSYNSLPLILQTRIQSKFNEFINIAGNENIKRQFMEINEWFDSKITKIPGAVSKMTLHKEDAIGRIYNEFISACKNTKGLVPIIEVDQIFNKNLRDSIENKHKKAVLAKFEELKTKNKHPRRSLNKSLTKQMTQILEQIGADIERIGNDWEREKAQQEREGGR